jgi:hypothetical protein
MVTRAFFALLLIAPALFAADYGRPSYTVTADGVIAVSFPAEVLRDEEVRRNLTSGLTTSFAVLATAGADRTRSAARIEVRYDLWDEQFLVRKIESDGHVSDVKLSSAEALEKWWRAASVRLARLPRPNGPLRVELEMTVYPFSVAEEHRTREWLARSASAAGSSLPRGQTADGTTPVAGATSSALIDALIGTTIHARPLLTFRWRTDVLAAPR